MRRLDEEDRKKERAKQMRSNQGMAASSLLSQRQAEGGEQGSKPKAKRSAGEAIGGEAGKSPKKKAKKAKSDSSPPAENGGDADQSSKKGRKAKEAAKTGDAPPAENEGDAGQSSRKGKKAKTKKSLKEKGHMGEIDSAAGDNAPTRRKLKFVAEKSASKQGKATSKSKKADRETSPATPTSSSSSGSESDSAQEMDVDVALTQAYKPEVPTGQQKEDQKKAKPKKQRQQRKKTKDRKSQVGADGSDEGGSSEEGPFPEEVIIQPSKPGEKPIKMVAAVQQLSWRDDAKRTDVKHGPFSDAEKDIIRRAVLYYAEERGLPKDSFDWITSKDKKDKEQAAGLWPFVARALPHRKCTAVNSAGIRMFNPRNHKGKWTATEANKLKELVDQHGHEWRKMEEEMGRFRGDCQHRWRDIQSKTNRITGRWSPEEEQKLIQLVLTQLKAGRQARSPVILDVINWAEVASKLSRSVNQCLKKWNGNVRGKAALPNSDTWTNEADKELLDAMHSFVRESGAMYEYEISWGELIPEKSSQEVRQRWRILERQVPSGRSQLELPEKVEYLQSTFVVVEEEEEEDGLTGVKKEEEGGEDVGPEEEKDDRQHTPATDEEATSGDSGDSDSGSGSDSDNESGSSKE